MEPNVIYNSIYKMSYILENNPLDKQYRCSNFESKF